MKRTLITLAALMLLATGSAQAGGFNIYEMGTRATALGGAFTATADNASAIFYNPAGLAWQDSEWEFSGSLSLVGPSAKYNRAAGLAALYPGDQISETTTRYYPPAGAYLSYRMPDAPFAFGVGFFTPFGLGVEWDNADSFPGRPLASNSQLKGFYLSPMATWQLRDDLAVSAGFHMVKSTITLERIVTLPAGQNAGDLTLDGSSNWAVGAAAGLMYRPHEKLTFGLNYKGGVNNKFEDQDADLVFRTAAPNISTTVNAELEYPTLLSLAARYQAAEKLAVEFDAVWFDWSVFKEVNLEFGDTLPNTIIEEDYKDTWQYRFGAEYQAREDLRLMVGLVVDESPQPVYSVSPLLPDADRIDYSLGASWDHEAWEFNLAYMLVDNDERSTVVNGVGQSLDGLDGTYTSIAHIFSFGIGRSF